MQILATALMVVLFRLKNYAIGVGLAKSEAILAAIVGVMFFGTYISPLGWGGVFIGGIAAFLLTGATSIEIFISQNFGLRFRQRFGLCLDILMGPRGEFNPGLAIFTCSGLGAVFCDYHLN